MKVTATERRPLSWWKLPATYSCTFADKLLAGTKKNQNSSSHTGKHPHMRIESPSPSLHLSLSLSYTQTPKIQTCRGYTQIQQSSAHAQNTHEICNQLQRAWGNSLSIPSAHQWRFHFLIPSSLQMRRRLSVDLSCLNSSHNCLCCVLGKAGVQSKYFQAERGSGMARRSAHVIWT